MCDLQAFYRLAATFIYFGTRSVCLNFDCSLLIVVIVMVFDLNGKILPTVRVASGWLRLHDLKSRRWTERGSI